tara:strand:- start:11 stop:553 length:543 start_codon:yes stop_codon:yes gene_type:complete
MSGSIPFGLVLTKLFLNQDIRNIGSKNIGATNVLRTGNKFIAGITLFLDILKGIIPILITKYFFPDLIFLSGLMAFLGHIFPIWLKFKGGKGVATYLGIIFALSLKLGLFFCIFWILIALISKYSSLSSIVSSLVIFIISFWENNFQLNSYLFITFVILLYTHKQNIIRIKNKTEDKIKL